MGVGRVLESIEILLESNDLLCLLVDSLPHDSVGTLACQRVILVSPYLAFAVSRTSSKRGPLSLQSLLIISNIKKSYI